MSTPAAAAVASRKLAVVFGVANHRSLAWACVKSLTANNYDCILACTERFQPSVQKLVDTDEKKQHIIANYAVNVQTDLPRFFTEQLTQHDRHVDAIVHSVAYANFESKHFSNASWEAYAEAQHISAYSVLETARCAVQSEILAAQASLTTLTYLGAVRAVPNYHIMGPAKASLEAIVRGLALEYGQYSAIHTDYEHHCLRVNAVSAGPIQTLSARGIPGFGALLKQTEQQSPLKRTVTAEEVADTVTFLTNATGITGQVIFVDGGYSSIVPL